MSKLKNIAAGVAVAGALALTTSAPALAKVTPNASFSCRQDGFCGSEVEVNTNFVWGISASNPRSNTPVVIQAFSDARSSQDFIATDVNGLGNQVKRFQFAPNDDKSGLCISQPRAAAYTKLVLRPCNNSVFQQFQAVLSPDGSGSAWESLQNNNLAIQDGSYRGLGNQLNVGPLTFGDNQLFDFNDTTTP